MADPSDSYAALVNAAQGWGQPSPQASVPATPAAAAPAQATDPAYTALANAASNWTAQGPAPTSQTTDPGFAGTAEQWVTQHLVPTIGGAAGAGMWMPLSLFRLAKKTAGMGNSPTANLQAAFRAAAQYPTLQAQNPPTPVEPSFGPVAPPPARPAPQVQDPSLLKYTRTQVLNPQALSASDLGDFGATTASRVQQSLPAIADRASRNLQLSQGFAQPDASGLYLPSEIAQQALDAKAQQEAALHALSSLPPSEPPAPTEAQVAQRAKQAYLDAKAEPWKGTGIPSKSYWSELGDPAVAAGRAQGALESAYPSTVGRMAARIGAALPTTAMPVVGGALSGLNAASALQDIHDKDWGRAVANGAAALGGLMMIPDNPVTPVAGAALQIPALAYSAYDAVSPYARQLWRKYVDNGTPGKP